jgi:hypothetical protein
MMDQDPKGSYYWFDTIHRLKVDSLISNTLRMH